MYKRLRNGCTGDLFGEVEQKTIIRFNDVADYETSVEAVDVDFDTDDVVFTGWVNKLKTHQVIIVKGSGCGEGSF